MQHCNGLFEGFAVESLYVPLEEVVDLGAGDALVRFADLDAWAVGMGATVSAKAVACACFAKHVGATVAIGFTGGAFVALTDLTIAVGVGLAVSVDTGPAGLDAKST